MPCDHDGQLLSGNPDVSPDSNYILCGECGRLFATLAKPKQPTPRQLRDAANGPWSDG